jgi:hypothetical protein
MYLKLTSDVKAIAMSRARVVCRTDYVLCYPNRRRQPPALLALIDALRV